MTGHLPVAQLSGRTKLGMLLALRVWLFVQYCCRSFMLWSVNSGGGYPYPNGTDIASYVSASNFKLLDTNGDGSITMADDPYAPYYPVRDLSSVA